MLNATLIRWKRKKKPTVQSPVVSPHQITTSPVADSTLAIIGCPCPAKTNNFQMTIWLLANLAQRGKVDHPRGIAEQAPSPSINSRLTSLISGLLEERNERGAAGST
jgi:hypothetical protein